MTCCGAGGAERHVLSLTTGLHSSGFQCRVAYLWGPDDLAREFERRGIPVHPLGLRYRLDPRGIARLVRLIHSEVVDLVHAHLFPGEVFGAAAAMLAGPVPIVCTKHNDEDFLQRWPFGLMHRLLSHKAQRTIVISEHLRRYTVAIGIADPTRIVTIPYGYDGPGKGNTREAARRELALDDGAFVVGAVGRLAKQKGHVYLLEAVPLLLEHAPDTRVVILGEGPMREDLTRRARELGVADRVTLYGLHPEIPRILPALDVLAHPSLWEGFGLVLLEAMAAALPIIASRVSAVPEIVEDEVTGLLVPPADPAALAKAILRLWENPEERKELGRAGAARLRESFSVATMVEQTARVYREVLRAA